MSDGLKKELADVRSEIDAVHERDDHRAETAQGITAMAQTPVIQGGEPDSFFQAICGRMPRIEPVKTVLGEHSWGKPCVLQNSP
jgi:hypothetical protein